MKIRRILFFVLAFAIGGCVFVSRNGSYSRTEVIEMSGSNRIQKLEIAPKP